MATISSVRHGRGRGHRRGESRRPGQWKLAYADFLTALMAFFLLMWLSTDSSQAERAAIAAVFTGAPTYETVATSPSFMEATRAELMAELTEAPQFISMREHIHLTEVATGLRIDISDASEQPLFHTASADLNETGQALITDIGYLLATVTASVSVEGHTDAFASGPDGVSNWELSSARAHAALGYLQAAGVNPMNINAVTGLAATKPLLPTQPHASVNRRVSIVLELPH